MTLIQLRSTWEKILIGHVSNLQHLQMSEEGARADDATDKPTFLDACFVVTGAKGKTTAVKLNGVYNPTDKLVNGKPSFERVKVRDCL
jgi:hypothetical protein